MFLKKDVWSGDKVHFTIYLKRTLPAGVFAPIESSCHLFTASYFAFISNGFQLRCWSVLLISEASFDTPIPRLTTSATSAKCLNIIRFHNRDGRQHPFRMSRVAHFRHFDKIPVCRRRRPTSPVLLRKLFASPTLTGLQLHLHSICFG